MKMVACRKGIVRLPANSVSAQKRFAAKYMGDLGSTIGSDGDHVISLIAMIIITKSARRGERGFKS
jgi:hypothetical protein